MPGQQDEKAVPKPNPDDKKEHPVDQQVQEEAAEERSENKGYD